MLSFAQLFHPYVRTYGRTYVGMHTVSQYGYTYVHFENLERVFIFGGRVCEYPILLLNIVTVYCVIHTYVHMYHVRMYVYMVVMF